MNKEGLVSSVVVKTGLTKKDSEKAVSGVLSCISECLAKREKVQLVNFGTFEVKDRAGRKGHNPQTGEEIEIKATRVPIFKAGKILKEVVSK